MTLTPAEIKGQQLAEYIMEAYWCHETLRQGACEALFQGVVHDISTLLNTVTAAPVDIIDYDDGSEAFIQWDRDTRIEHAPGTMPLLQTRDNGHPWAVYEPYFEAEQDDWNWDEALIWYTELFL